MLYNSEAGWSPEEALRVNVFNRVVTILLLLLLLGLAAVTAVFPLEVLAFLQRGLTTINGYLQALQSAGFWLFLVTRAFFLIVAAVVFGLLLWAEVRPPRRHTVRVHTEGGSQAEVTTDSVARRLTWQIEQLADVISVEPQVTPRGHTVDVFLDVQTSPDVDVPMKTDEVVNCAREVIGERMGLQPGKIQIRITHVPYQDEA
jgi:hypothetical protein